MGCVAPGGKSELAGTWMETVVFYRWGPFPNFFWRDYGKVRWTWARTSVFRPRFEACPSGIEVRSELFERKLARCRQDHNNYVIAAITFTPLTRQCLFSKKSVASRICASRDWARIIRTTSTYLRVCMREYSKKLPGTRGGIYCEFYKA